MSSLLHITGLLTDLFEVWDRLGCIIRPVSLECNTSAVDTSLQIPELVYYLGDSYFNRCVVCDVDLHIDGPAIRRDLFCERLSLVLWYHIQESDVSTFS